MRTILFICLMATQAVYAKPGPVDTERLEQALMSMSADSPEPGQAATEKVWARARKHLAAHVFVDVDSASLYDGQKLFEQRWLSGRQRNGLSFRLTHLINHMSSGSCTASVCSFGGVHGLVYAMYVRPVAGGSFEIAGLLEYSGNALNDRLARWQDIIEAGPQHFFLPDVPPDGTGSWPSKRSRRSNREGLKALREKRYPAAVKAFQAGLAADPGDHLQRYNLACAQSLSGQIAAALETLKSFADAECQACQVRLVRARTDPDFRRLRWIPGFEVLVRSARMPEFDLRMAARSVDEAFGAGVEWEDGLPHPAFMGGRRQVELRMRNAVNRRTNTIKVSGFSVYQRLEQLRADESLEPAPMLDMQCTATCCTSRNRPIKPGAMALQQVCLTTDKTGWTTIGRVDMIYRPRRQRP